MTPPQAAFGAYDVTVQFDDVVALRDITVVIPQGQVTVVVGGDGAGKTTLLRALVGRVPLARGQAQVPPRSQLGYLSARAASWAALSVTQNVEFVGGAYGLHGEPLAARAAELLGSAGLAPYGDRLAGQLSGGMRRKLGFVLAMLHRPALLVLDEPSTGVDPVSRVDLWRMSSQAAAAGAAVIMSTTYLDEAERASSLLLLDHGELLAAGTPAEVMAGLPGGMIATTAPTRRDRAWRRGRVFHEWFPEGEIPSGANRIVADLEDVAIARTLAAREVAS
ncbi:MAG: ABC transporter ATP-binding protein [Candidatus Nanopelagicales bacterium]